MEKLWLVFGLLSDIMAALVAIFGKIGLQSVDANAATAIRAVIMTIFLILVVVCQGSLAEIPAIIADKYSPQWRCRSAVLAVLFSGSQIRQCIPGCAYR